MQPYIRKQLTEQNQHIYLYNSITRAKLKVIIIFMADSVQENEIYLGHGGLL